MNIELYILLVLKALYCVLSIVASFTFFDLVLIFVQNISVQTFPSIISFFKKVNFVYNCHCLITQFPQFIPSQHIATKQHDWYKQVARYSLGQDIVNHSYQLQNFRHDFGRMNSFHSILISYKITIEVCNHFCLCSDQIIRTAYHFNNKTIFCLFHACHKPFHSLFAFEYIFTNSQHLLW